MELSPRLYHTIIRPQWLTNLYIANLLQDNLSLHNKTVLDFGCGTGANCELFSADNYIGVDINKNRINYAQNLYPDYQFQALKKNSPLPFSPNTFDQILIIAVLHHISNKKLQSLLSSFHRILQPEGKIIVIEPYLKADNLLNNYFMQIMDNGNYIRSQEEYFSIFKDHNYNPQLIKKYSKLFFYQELFFIAAH